MADDIGADIAAASQTGGNRVLIEIESPGPEAVLRLSGQLDVSDAHRVPETVGSLFADTTPPQTVILDLSDVSFADSVGLGMLLRSDEEARRNDARLVLRSPSPAVRRLLSMTAMDTVFEIFADGESG